MPRRPLGTYTRTTADWFLNETFCVPFYAIPVVGNAFTAVGLYNADQHGRVIVLDGIDVSCPGFIEEAHIGFGFNGTLEQSAQPIVSGNAIPAVNVTSYNTTASSAPLIEDNHALLFFTFAAGQTQPMQVRARGPLAYLKPGYSYIVGSRSMVTAILTVNFYFCLLKE